MSAGVPLDRATRAHVELARTWAAVGRTSRAEASYLRAIAQAPDDARAQLGLALLQLAGGETAAARRCLEAWGRRHLRDCGLVDNVAVFEQIGPPAATPPAETSAYICAGLPAALAPLRGRRWDVLLYSDCGGRTTGVAGINRALIGALVARGLGVVCAQPAGSEPLDGVSPHVALAHRDVYDPRRIAAVDADDAEPERILSTLRPRLVLFADGSPMSNLAAKRRAHALGIPFASVVHCVDAAWAERFAVRGPAIAAAMRRAARVIAVSRATLRQLEASFGLPPGRGAVVGNACADAFFEPVDAADRHRARADLDVGPGDVLCLTVGRMEAAKGYPYLLDALARLKGDPLWPRLAFVWGGIGTEALRYRIRAEELDVADRIRFVGRRVPVETLLGAADLFILPSQFEGMPLAVLEAMARGVPVLATAVGGTPEALGRSGVALPDPRPNSEPLVRALVDEMRRLAAHAEGRADLGRRGARRARRRFNASRMVRGYLDLLLPLVEGGRRP